MTAPLLLMLIAGSTGVMGARLARSSWPRRAPRWGVLLWQALSWCFVASLVLAGLALAVPTMPWTVSSGVADFLGACAIAVREHYATPGGAIVGALGAVAAAAVIVRVSAQLFRDAWSVDRARRRQRVAVGLVARLDSARGAWIIDDRRPAAYCLPGRSPMVVVTTGTVDDLCAAELDAVLAHERAHARGRHDLVIQVASALHRAFPMVPLLRAAAEQIPSLLEMHADDRAARAHGRQPLATALVRLAGAAGRPSGATVSPLGALFATGGQTLARVERLAARENGLSRARCWLAAAAVVLVILTPAVAAAAPAVEAVFLDYCPVILD